MNLQWSRLKCLGSIMYKNIGKNVQKYWGQIFNIDKSASSRYRCLWLGLLESNTPMPIGRSEVGRDSKNLQCGLHIS